MIHPGMNSHPRVPTPMREKENKDGGRGDRKDKLDKSAKLLAGKKTILLTFTLVKRTEKRNLRGEFIIY